MKKTYTCIVIDKNNNVVKEDYFLYDGPVDLACGASDEQKETYKEQNSFFKTLTSQAVDEFGNATHVFNDLFSTFSPIVHAGPNQEGYDAATMSDLSSQAITQAGESARQARTAARQIGATVGGGNMVLPGGFNVASELGINNAAASLKAQSLAKIRSDSRLLGRENFFKAADILGGSTNVFNPSTGMANAATGAGSAASQTANEIAQANNGWMNMVGGILGGVASGVATGGMSNLGKGVGFFGGNAPCYVAAELYGGWFAPKTMALRAYLMSPSSPQYIKDFTNIYIKHGQEWARRIKSNFELRRFFSELFDGFLQDSVKIYG